MATNSSSFITTSSQEKADSADPHQHPDHHNHHLHPPPGLDLLDESPPTRSNEWQFNPVIDRPSPDDKLQQQQQSDPHTNSHPDTSHHHSQIQAISTTKSTTTTQSSPFETTGSNSFRSPSLEPGDDAAGSASSPLTTTSSTTTINMHNQQEANTCILPMTTSSPGHKVSSVPSGARDSLSSLSHSNRGSLNRLDLVQSHSTAVTPVGSPILTKNECWICYDSDRTDAGPLIHPCSCKGDVSAVHHECLKLWLMESCSNPEHVKCKVCKESYKVQPGDFWLPSGLTISHWVQTAFIITIMCVAAIGVCVIVKLFDHLYVRTTSVGAAILIEYICLRFVLMMIQLIVSMSMSAAAANHDDGSY